MTITEPRITDESDRDVAAFLLSHPHWLAARPDIYGRLSPPIRVHGDHAADHMQAMLDRARAQETAMSLEVETVLAAGRARAASIAKVQNAVIALATATDPVECIVTDLPRLLGVDAVNLCVPAPIDGARLVADSIISALLGQRDVVARTAPDDAVLLHEEAAPLAAYDALIRVPGTGMLALASRDRSLGEPGRCSAAFAFLGRMTAAVLRR